MLKVVKAQAADSVAKKLLKKAGLKVTRHRQKALDILLANPDTPVSIDEMVERMDHDLDRVTAYRILNCFNELGLIERVTHLSNKLKFVLSPGQVKKHRHLVTCRLCGATVTAYACVQSGWQDELESLGFQEVSHNLSFTGICSDH